MPRVSIGLPVYNGSNYLTEAITSVLEQDFDDFELLISDNASTDTTWEICQHFAQIDSRVKIERQTVNKGAAFNYNRVFDMASGDYFKWLAHDDRILPSFLSTCLDGFAQARGPVSIVYPRSDLIDEHGAVIKMDCDRQQARSDWKPVRAFQALQEMSFAASVFGLIDVQTLRRTTCIGAFISSDYALLLQLAVLGKIIQIDGAPLFQRRVHAGMSRVANTSHADVLAWFDPKAASHMNERQRLVLEYLKSSFQVKGLNIAERVLCTAAVAAGVSFKSGRVSFGRARRRVFNRQLVGSTPS